MLSDYTHIIFDTDIGRTKPENIINREAKCPFCHRHELDGIIAVDEPLLLIKNKYPVLADAFQTVLIETYDCDDELSRYSKAHLYKLIRFGVGKWQEMMASGEFASVLFFKNHGPYSGGTIRHPHMQIVGLKYYDYTANIIPATLEGLVIDREDGVELNLSTRPRIGFFEFNAILSKYEKIDRLADYIQAMAHYALNNFHKGCNSYNLFFYQLEDRIAVKIMPRFVTSPLFIGYSIPQVSSRIEEVAKKVRKIYF